MNLVHEKLPTYIGRSVFDLISRTPLSRQSIRFLSLDVLLDWINITTFFVSIGREACQVEYFVEGMSDSVFFQRTMFNQGIAIIPINRKTSGALRANLFIKSQLSPSVIPSLFCRTVM